MCTDHLELFRTNAASTISSGAKSEEDDNILLHDYLKSWKNRWHISRLGLDIIQQNCTKHAQHVALRHAKFVNRSLKMRRNRHCAHFNSPEAGMLMDVLYRNRSGLLLRRFVMTAPEELMWRLILSRGAVLDRRRPYVL